MISRGQSITLGTIVVVAAGIATVFTAFEKVGLDVPRPVWIDELEELRTEYDRTNKWNTRTLIVLVENDIELLDKRIEENEGGTPFELIRRKVYLENRKKWLEMRLE